MLQAEAAGKRGPPVAGWKFNDGGRTTTAALLPPPSITFTSPNIKFTQSLIVHLEVYRTRSYNSTWSILRPCLFSFDIILDDWAPFVCAGDSWESVDTDTNALRTITTTKQLFIYYPRKKEKKRKERSYFYSISRAICVSLFLQY